MFSIPGCYKSTTNIYIYYYYMLRECRRNRKNQNKKYNNWLRLPTRRINEKSRLLPSGTYTYMTFTMPFYQNVKGEEGSVSTIVHMAVTINLI